MKYRVITYSNDRKCRRHRLQELMRYLNLKKGYFSLQLCTTLLSFSNSSTDNLYFIVSMFTRKKSKRMEYLLPSPIEYATTGIKVLVNFLSFEQNSVVQQYALICILTT